MEPNDDKTRFVTVLSKGTVVSHYRIVEKIGAGGMGEVYLADDIELNRKVALKFLSSHLCQDADCRARFKREAQAAAKLNHPNIVTIYEVSEFNGRPFFAMEHVEGESLRELIKAKELPIERVMDLAIQICDGLHKAHLAGIVHRDVKPANILIDNDGRAKILDFGLATVQGCDHLTKTGSTLGTIGYMSPEQVRGEQVDHRTDIFSLGVVLYEMITRRQPFRSDNDAATSHNIIGQEPEPLVRYKSGVSTELQRAVGKALAKDKSVRYQHADELSVDLRNMMRIVSGSGVSPGSPPMLVVLPFDNLGPADQEYFADGMTEEIITRLANMKGLGVISRTSAMKYKGARLDLRQIGAELRVDYVVEGSVLWARSGDVNRVRINAQLIEVSNDTHLWAERFDRNFEDIFSIQSDIAQQVASALDVTLRGSEEQALREVPTKNLEAYNLYLRGKEYWENKMSVGRAIHLLEKAVALDPSFYRAYAFLVSIYGFAYINNVPGGKERSGQAKVAAERALQLAGGRPEGYLAMGRYHYYFSRDYDRALELFHKALEGQPNDSELLAAIGYAQRRQGKWEEAVDNLRKAFQLDPGLVDLANGLSQTLFSLHRLCDAERVIDRGLELTPDSEILLIWKTYFAGTTGDTSKVLAALNKAEEYAEGSFFAQRAELVDTYLRDYKSALGRRKSAGSDEFDDKVDFYLSKGRIYAFLHETTMSREHYDSARIICEKAVVEYPDDASNLIRLAEAYAGLSRKEDAIREGRKAAELLPVSKDAVSGAAILLDLAGVYAMVGEYDLAVDLLEHLLSIPSRLQVFDVRVHPTWDPLRHLPRFQKLLEKYDT